MPAYGQPYTIGLITESMDMSRSRKQGIMVLAIVCFLVGIWIFRFAPMGFDSAEWKNGEVDSRFRMKAALESMYDAGYFKTKSQVEKSLGQPIKDYAAKNLWRYDMGSGLLSGPYYLLIHFTSDGLVAGFRIVPD